MNSEDQLKQSVTEAVYALNRARSCARDADELDSLTQARDMVWDILTHLDPERGD